MIVQVSVALRGTVWDDIDWCFDNLSGSYLQSQLICVTPVDGINSLAIDVIGQLSQLSADVYNFLHPTNASSTTSTDKQHTDLLYHSTARSILRYTYRC